MHMPLRSGDMLRPRTLGLNDRGDGSIDIAVEEHVGVLGDILGQAGELHLGADGKEYTQGAIVACELEHLGNRCKYSDVALHRKITEHHFILLDLALTMADCIAAANTTAQPRSMRPQMRSIASATMPFCASIGA